MKLRRSWMLSIFVVMGMGINTAFGQSPFYEGKTIRIVIGFSAGAGLTMHCTLNSKSMELDFIGPIYGGMGPVEVPKNAPPMFNVIASDDFLFRGQFGVVDSWFKAGRPVEFHLYQNGGHGFGLGNPDRTSNRWFDAFMYWLEVNRFLAKSGK